MTPPNSYRGRLFTMMALEFFIWGAWLPLIFGYLPSLGFTPTQQSLILNAFPVASIVGMPEGVPRATGGLSCRALLREASDGGA
jgi:hypothetical protein